MPAKTTPNRLSPTIRPVAISTPRRFVNSTLSPVPLGPLVVVAAEEGADRDQQGQRHRQVHAHADGQRRQPQLREAAEQLVDHDHHGADRRAEPDQLPVQVAAEARPSPAPRSARPAARPARSRPRPGAPAKPNAALSRSSTGGITSRTEDHADDQRDLLLPRRRADQLAGLEVLQVVVGDRGDAEHDRGGEQRVGDQRRGALRVARRGRSSATSTSDAPSTDRMPTPGDRAVRRADQPGHVAGHRRDHRADDDDEDQRDRRSAAGDVAGRPGRLRRSPTAARRSGSARTAIVPPTMPIGRSRSVSSAPAAAAPRCAADDRGRADAARRSGRGS